MFPAIRLGALRNLSRAIAPSPRCSIRHSFASFHTLTTLIGQIVLAYASAERPGQATRVSPAAGPGQFRGALAQARRFAGSKSTAPLVRLPNKSFKGNNNRTDSCPLNSGVRPQRKSLAIHNICSYLCRCRSCIRCPRITGVSRHGISLPVRIAGLDSDLRDPKLRRGT